MQKHFHPHIADWFTHGVGQPTALQQDAWDRISQGEHVLISAPTGSGKTLAAFLWAIDQLVRGCWRPGRPRVLYVSPLKALNEDVRRNLIQPVKAIQSIFETAGDPVPTLAIATRSGDTPQEARRRMLRQPPEILITTPESLNLLLSSQGGRTLLDGLRTVILDELHAVLGNKRGTHLITAVERLVELSGEFQRIGLSATIRPLKLAAKFLGGFRLNTPQSAPMYTPRKVRRIAEDTEQAPPRRYELSVGYYGISDPELELPREGERTLWDELTDDIHGHMARCNTTAVYVNSRRLCEKLALLINGKVRDFWAYAHHGSLAPDLRRSVEQRLKSGELKGVVATSSLELGIDIGDLDQVILVESPPTVSAAIQRLGRAGHHLGGISRGRFLPSHPMDLVVSTALTRAVGQGDLEETRPVEAPLDVLTQVLLSMVGSHPWKSDDLYAAVRVSYPYRRLGRDQFDQVLEMLAGQYGQLPLRELRPRISLDKLSGRVTLRRGALIDLYRSGGTIPDRGYFQLRQARTRQVIGELDEEFVWEARRGQTFAFGAHSWRITEIRSNEVRVEPVAASVADTPFFKAEGIDRDSHLAETIARFLGWLNTHREDPRLEERLMDAYPLEPSAARALATLVQRQVEATGQDLPHRRHLLVETVERGLKGAPGSQIIWHTLWGGRVNRPLGLALEAAWQSRFGYRPEIFISNECLVLQLPADEPCPDLLDLVTAETLPLLLEKRLGRSGFFGARFRECAQRGLLLPKGGFNSRQPLWLSRLKAKKLLKVTSGLAHFPMVTEAWRTCLQDYFDLPNTRRMLRELQTGRIAVSRASTSRPSPLAAHLAWRQVDSYMYADDTPDGDSGSRLEADLFTQVLDESHFRPAVDRSLIEDFESRRQRLAPGYGPASATELLDWVKARLALPWQEWFRLVKALEAEQGLTAETIATDLKDKLLRLNPAPDADSLVVAREQLPLLMHGLYGPARPSLKAASLLENEAPLDLPEPAGAELPAAQSLLAVWLSYYGPQTEEEISARSGLPLSLLKEWLPELVNDRRLVNGSLVADSAARYFCDADNYEILLRMKRRRQEPQFTALPLDRINWFWAVYHQWGAERASPEESPEESLARAVESLLCYPAAAHLWEKEFFPARMANYHPRHLDPLLQQGDLLWSGTSGQRIQFCPQAETDLIAGVDSDPEKEPGSPDAPDLVREILPDPDGRYDLAVLLKRTQLPTAQLVSRLWRAVWQGTLTNDSAEALRYGIRTRFQEQTAAPTAVTHGRRRRSGKRWSRGRRPVPYRRRETPWPSIPGTWRRVPPAEAPADAFERAELKRARVQVLLARYGVLFRELLADEAPAFRWREAFPVLRRMELSGEVLSGTFFQTIPGPQFISPQALTVLTRGLPTDYIFWICTQDPLSPCRIAGADFKADLPPRADGSHLVFHDCRRVLISRQSARKLTIRVAEEHPNLKQYFNFMRHLLERPFEPLKKITVETINGKDAATSPYTEILEELFDVVQDHRCVTLYRKRF